MSKKNILKYIYKKLRILLKYILFFIYLIFEQFVINIAKKLLLLIKRFNVYEKFINYICNANDFVLLSSFLLIAVIADICATFAIFLAAKGLVVLGILFYILKIIIYIPAIDIFKQNKKRLLKYKIIRVVFYWYLLIIKSETYRTVKKALRQFKNRIKTFFITPPDKYTNF